MGLAISFISFASSSSFLSRVRLRSSSASFRCRRAHSADFDTERFPYRLHTVILPLELPDVFVLQKGFVSEATARSKRREERR